MKLGQGCFIVRDANNQALAYVYFEDEPGRRVHLVSQATGKILAMTMTRSGRKWIRLLQTAKA
jgi:hypothetical protein